MSFPLALTGSVGDPSRTGTVYAAILFLIALGVGLIIVAIWLYRATRSDPPLLAPLERMGERSWRKADPVWQRRQLDDLRPPGAEPLVVSRPLPSPDAAFDLGPLAPGFDDLQSDAAAAAAAAAASVPLRPEDASQDVPVEVVSEDASQDAPVEVVSEDAAQDVPVEVVSEDASQDAPVEVVSEDASQDAPVEVESGDESQDAPVDAAAVATGVESADGVLHFPSASIPHIDTSGLPAEDGRPPVGSG